MTCSQKYIFLLKPSKYIVVLFIISLFSVGSCRKYSDPAPIEDERLDTNFYCNDPDAVNYNWDFPGTPDQGECIFPADAFEGSYTILDSSFSTTDSFVSASVYNNGELDKVANNYVNLSNYCNTSIKLLLTTFLEISTDTADGHTYDQCVTDTFTLSGIKLSIDTTEFVLTKTPKNSAEGYSTLHFIKN